MYIEKYEASWCQPCKVLTKVLAESDFAEDDIEVVDIETLEGAALATKNSVRGVPTIIFRDDYGEELFRHTGSTNLQGLRQMTEHAKERAREIDHKRVGRWGY